MDLGFSRFVWLGEFPKVSVYWFKDPSASPGAGLGLHVGNKHPRSLWKPSVIQLPRRSTEVRSLPFISRSHRANIWLPSSVDSSTAEWGWELCPPHGAAVKDEQRCRWATSTGMLAVITAGPCHLGDSLHLVYPGNGPRGDEALPSKDLHSGLKTALFGVWSPMCCNFV